MPNNVRIENPIHAGGAITSRKRAERYVSRGVARWIAKDRIRFIEPDYRRLSAVAAHSEKQWRDECARRGYDRIGHMTLDQVAGLPTTGPAIKVFVLPTKRGPGFCRDLGG
jgi:hypothetical protein